LEGALQGDGEGRPDVLGGRFARGGDGDAGCVYGEGGDAAGQGHVRVDEELEEVVDLVGELADGAGLGEGGGVWEGKGLRGLVADVEGYVL